MSKTTQINVFHGFSRITPLPKLALLEKLLAYSEKQFAVSTKGKITETTRLFRRYEINKRNQLIIPTGLVDSAIDHLTAAGLEIQKTDHRHFNERHSISQAVVAQSSQDERCLLEAVQQNPLGQIQVSNINEMVSNMALICRGVPEARILIPVAQKRLGWFLQQKINEKNPELKVSYRRQVTCPNLLYQVL